ncbi:unnamed protein product [Urochloa decumbens]|uniref:F-box protein AT5G49610-like beta-propeller domain-containing protein n=1 Tax=Urochloa decumbens TaxID=240449 RepID=A0ABC9GBT7_9POAL
MDLAAAAFVEMDELVEEVLIRFPPHDPARLAGAALVCKRWCRILTGAGFRRRFRQRHRAAPPMLGFLHRPLPVPPYDGVNCGFMRTTSFRPRGADLALGGAREPLDCRHGRVLIGRPPKVCDKSDCCLAVWDPVTGEKLELLEPPLCREWSLLNWNAAVLCASSRDGACDHLDCHRGPFLVLVVGTNILVLFACVYSSEDGAWSKPTYALQPMEDNIVCFHLSEPSVLAGNALCLISANDMDLDGSIIKYDLSTSKIDQIQLPPSTTRHTKSVVLTATENGGLGCAIVEHSRLSLWLWVAGPKEQWVWAQSRVIELEKIIPDDDILISYRLVGFAHGLDVLFTTRFDGLFIINLKSGRMKKLCKGPGIYSIIPYVSFCTPALRVISTGDESSAGASSAHRTPVSDARTESVCAGEGPSAGASSA